MSVSINAFLQGIGTTSENTSQPQTKTESKTPSIRIEVQPEPFDGTLKSKYVTSQDLSDMVNSVFKTTMHDYYGCAILPVESVNFALGNQLQGGKMTYQPSSSSNLVLLLYFIDKGEAPAQSYKCIRTPEVGNNMVARMNAISFNRSNRTYILTEEAKSILTPFVEDSHNNNGKIRWEDISAEVNESSGVGNIAYGSRICVSVRIDLLKVIKEVYKTKIGDHYMDYAVSLIRPLVGINPSPYGNVSSNFIVSITQLDNKEVENLCKKVGMVANQSNLYMIRA